MRWWGVDFAVTDEQRDLRAELRQYFQDLLTPEVQAALWADEMGGPVWKEQVKRIAADGWLGIGWPKEYGGQDRSPIEQLIFYDEAQRAEAPVPMLSINTVGPTIMRFGTQDQKDRFLPGILAGDLNFAVGYTEPGAGTDLASLKTRAVRDGDEYVVNGQKVFTSLGATADYVWLATRTDPEAPRHKGISIFLMPTDTPGFSVVPLNIMGGADTTATFYEDVRIPAANLVGGENNGWSLITNQLNHERVAICNAGIIWRYLEEVTEWARKTSAVEQEWVRLGLARVRLEGRGPAAHELEGGLGADRRRPEPGRRVGHEGLRHPRLHRVPRHPHGDHRAALLPAGRLGRGPPPGPHGAQLPGDPGPHLRRRDERDPAGHRRHARPRHAAGAAMSLPAAVDFGGQAGRRHRRRVGHRRGDGVAVP